MRSLRWVIGLMTTWLLSGLQTDAVTEDAWIYL